MAQQMLLDMRDGEIFIHTGKVLKSAIYSQIQNELKTELNGYMAEVLGELDGMSPSDIASLLLRLKMNKKLDAKSLLVYECLRRAATAQEEIEFLEHIQGNLMDDVIYKLSLDQVVRYGVHGGAK